MRAAKASARRRRAVPWLVLGLWTVVTDTDSRDRMIVGFVTAVGVLLDTFLVRALSRAPEPPVGAERRPEPV
ncbi:MULTISPECIES: hypothetical protein [Streptomyces]|uniref:hypothetical protein n=1 Tax=Streptomyces TaxID=1883 RepID=UPI000A42F999|nr:MULTISPECIES: hypothetical protein [Streptomyces]